MTKGTKSEPLLSPIPPPSEAQLEAGAVRDPNANLVDDPNVRPPMSDDQRNTAINGNAPHIEPDDDPRSTDERLGFVESVDDLDENGRPRDGKTHKGSLDAERGTRNEHE